jgi:FixJ family two-component response regulator
VSDADRVFVVDDEPALRRALERLLRGAGFDVTAFDSGEAFLGALDEGTRGCLVLDVAMPGIDGLAVQAALGEARNRLPIVFLTGHGDIPMSVQAMKAGAVDFLTKPVQRADLLRAVEAGLARVRATGGLRERFALLTPREREVLQHVIAGRMNKVIAGSLGTTEHTVKVHRGRVMEKMGAASVVDLARMAEALGVPPID